MRLLFPAGDERLVYQTSGTAGTPLLNDAGTLITVYLDVDGVDVATDLQHLDGSPLTSGQILTDPSSLLPQFLGPPDGTSVLYARPAGSVLISPLTGAPQSGSVLTDASPTEKGILRLTGDLGGTADAPLVPGLALKAPINSPVFTGTPAAPTAVPGTNTNQLATTAFTAAAVAALVNSAPGTLDTLGELAAALAADESIAAALATTVGGKQPLDADLTTIAALDATTAGALATDGAGWIRKTYAQLKTALGLVKADVGLGSVDNTADTAKPVSTAQQTALNLKANLDSPPLTGTPTAPTAAPGTSTTQLATTAFTAAAVTALINGAPGILDTLGEIATQLQSDETAATALTTAVSLRQIIVNHGATAGTARPTSSLPVRWYGTVDPTNGHVTNDEWYDQANDLLKRWSGSAWVVAGIATFQPIGINASRVAFLGDSIAALNGTGDNVATFENTIDNFTGHIPVLSGGRIAYGRSFATGGLTLAQIRSTVVPRLLAATTLPGTVVLLGGTNDAGLGVSFSLTAAMAALDGIRTDLAAVGIKLVLSTIPPRGDSGTANTNATILNATIHAYARKYGLSVLDFYSALVVPSTGAYTAAYDNGDHIHPSPAGMLAMASHPSVTTWLSTLPGWKPALVKSSVDGASFVTASQALMLADSNADGVADGLSAFGGTKTPSLVAASTADIVGQWQKISRTSADTGGTAFLQFNSTLSAFGVVGDRLSLACRFKVSGATGAYSATTGAFVSLGLANSSNTDLDAAKYQTSQDVDGLVYLERTIVANTGKIKVTFGLDIPSTGTANFQFAQVSVRNLTALGYV